MHRGKQSELGTEQVAGRAYVMGRSSKMFPNTAQYESPYLKELMGETGLAKFLLTPQSAATHWENEEIHNSNVATQRM